MVRLSKKPLSIRLPIIFPVHIRIWIHLGGLVLLLMLPTMASEWLVAPSVSTNRRWTGLVLRENIEKDVCDFCLRMVFEVTGPC